MAMTMAQGFFELERRAYNRELKPNFDEMVAYLDKRFGHADFWGLPPEWKRVRYAQALNMIVACLSEGESPEEAEGDHGANEAVAG
jgi:hypothetical protein